MKIQYVIIGGGIAGLCAAIRLAELGEEPLLIEGGSYPTHKVCGEFLSPECLPFLHHWNIHPIPISRMVLRTLTNSLSFSFPSPAGALSHIQLDPALASYASKHGTKILTQTQVTAFQPKQHSNEKHFIQLSNGETLEASHVIIATGRIPHPSMKVPKMHYMGFKAHFENIISDGALEMFSFPGAYLGVAPIENHRYNVACLANLEIVSRWKNPQAFIEQLISQHPRLEASLSQGKNLFDQWMIAPIPAFGFKQTPNWLDTYFIGDAAATIPPACGNGLSMAILGGRIAAEYAKQCQAREFKDVWRKRCASQLFWGKFLHRLMLRPSWGNPMMRLSNCIPFLSNKIFEFTRQRA